MDSKQNTVPNGLYVLRMDKATTLAKVGELLLEFRRELNSKDSVKKCKEMRHRILRFLEDYFFPDTYGFEKSVLYVKGMSTDDINMAIVFGQELFGFLLCLRPMIENAFTLNELPSCRALLDDSKENAALKAVDLIKNDIIKNTIHALHIGKGVYDLCTIPSVERFYQDGLDEFEREKSEGRNLSLREQMLEDKFRMEHEYCCLVALHITGKLTKEMLEMEKSRIEEQEHKLEQRIGFGQEVSF